MRPRCRALVLAVALAVCTPATASAQPRGPVGGRVVAWGDPELATVPRGLDDVVAVSTSGWHVLALRSDGTVVAWGDPEEGATAVPRDLGRVTAVAAGQGFSLALLSDGTVRGWGRARPLAMLHVPPGLDHVVAIAAGDNHALALRDNGAVVAWGSDRDGQIAVPDPLGDIVAIAAGGFFSSALRADGTVVSWGYNVQLGDVLVYPSPEGGDSPANPVKTVHSRYSGLSNAVAGTGALGHFTAMDAEWDHLVALASDGTVKVTGSSYNPGHSVPAGLHNIISVAAGSLHNLVLCSDGTVTAWGGVRDPETDSGVAAAASRVPAGLRDVIAIAAGGGVSLAITTSD